MRLFRCHADIDKFYIWLYYSAMSEIGPERERTSFDFDANYHGEREVVYSDKGLERLFYEESPTFLVRPWDVKDLAGEPPVDQKIADILEDANKGSSFDADANATIPRAERAFLFEGRKMFALLDEYPSARCTPEELKRKIEVRYVDVQILAANADDYDDPEIAAQVGAVARLEKIFNRRLRSDTGLGNLLGQIDRERALHLETATTKIKDYLARLAAREAELQEGDEPAA
jgi:hypothetical protein